MGLLFTVFGWLGIAVLTLSFGLYAVIQLLCGTYYKTQNLKKRYNAQWGLVTGSSSGAWAPSARTEQPAPLRVPRPQRRIAVCISIECI